MNREFATLVPVAVVTSTLAAPAAWAGVTAVMVVELTTLKLEAATPPMVTAVAPVKSVPVMVRVLPPAAEPVTGEILVMVGAGAGAAPLNSKAPMLGAVEERE